MLKAFTVTASDPLESEDVQVFAHRLGNLSVRAQQVMTLVVLEGRTLDEAAKWFGISQDALELMFLRSAQELAELPSSKRRDEERQTAKSLAKAWSQPHASGWAGPLIPLMTPLTRMRQLAPKIVQARQALAVAEEQSPTTRRNDLLRRVLIFVVVVVSAYLYWKQRR
jgi:hypothetical protein